MKTLSITKRQEQSIRNYKRLGIDIEVLEDDTVKITQSRLINGFILNQKQLHDRAKEVFPDYKIIPVVFSIQLESINEQWILERMNEFGIKRKDLIKQLAMDKSYLSLLFAESSNKRKINLSKQVKSLFFYYFLTYELNRDFRENQ